MKSKPIFTQSVHAGERAPQPDYTPAVTPIHNSVVYLYDQIETLHQVMADERPGYIYSRYGNPTVEALEQAVAILEGGERAVAFASGMAAIHAALLGGGLRAGDIVVASRDVYGATYRLFNEILAQMGIRVHFVDIADTAKVTAILEQERPRLLHLETMSNPLLVIPDLPSLVEAAHRVGALVVVDNTFATPYLLRPLEHGVDLVAQSVTKYLSGHDDVLAGAVITREEFFDPVRAILRVAGGFLGPNEAWLAHRGIKTFALRMRQHCENAARVATWLEGHPAVRRVYYPGLPSHPQHEIAARLFRPGAFGGMVSFELKRDTVEAAVGVLQRLQLIVPAATLGGVRSLMMHPTSTSHHALSPEQRAAWGIHDGLLRLSVGIEEAQDIIVDLEQALGGL